MSPVRMVYLALTALGLIFPARRFYEWFSENGLDISALREALTINLASTGAATSMVIVATALALFIVVESRAREDTLSLIAVPVTIFLGPAVGLPLYLFLRTRRLD